MYAACHLNNVTLIHLKKSINDQPFHEIKLWNVVSSKYNVKECTTVANIILHRTSDVVFQEHKHMVLIVTNYKKSTFNKCLTFIRTIQYIMWSFQHRLNILSKAKDKNWVKTKNRF